MCVRVYVCMWSIVVIRVYIFISKMSVDQITTTTTDPSLIHHHHYTPVLSLYRKHCNDCYPINAYAPIMYMVLLGDDIILTNRHSIDNKTYITRTSHPPSLLQAINQHPSYIRCSIHKHLSYSSNWSYKLVIGPIHKDLIHQIIDLEKQWEKYARKILSRLIWGIEWWLSMRTVYPTINCYIDPTDQPIVIEMLEHKWRLEQQQEIIHLKSIYEQILAPPEQNDIKKTKKKKKTREQQQHQHQE